MKGKITLLGVKQAKVGFTFIHGSEAEECNSCEYRKICVRSLEKGRVYEVTEVLDRVLPCKLHEGGVKAVRVVNAAITVAVRSKQAIEGAIITFKPIKCDISSCSCRELCSPTGLFEGDKCKIERLYGRIPCLKGLDLVKAVVRLFSSQTSQ